MDFFSYKCPVCDKQFEQNDDIVVCPECGTPHHRACYEEHGHCFNEDKHSQDFSFEETNDKAHKSEANETSDIVICPNCNEENPKTTFYCSRCGCPLTQQNEQANYSQNGNEQSDMPPFNMPFNGGYSQMNVVMFDPMAGFKNDDEIGENVTAGEMSKFVGKTTPYFLRIFGNIKKFNKSRFNFCAFFFNGIYFFYRKMNLFGVLISVATLLFTVLSTLIQLTPDYQALFDIFSANAEAFAKSYVPNLMVYFDGMTQNQILFFCIPLVLNLLDSVLMFVCGFTANRLYYKHCVKKINSIKKESKGENINKTLEQKGGVNLALAVCVTVAFTVISYIPMFL